MEFSKWFQRKYMFRYRRMITVMMVSLSTIHVFVPTYYRPMTFIVCIVIIFCFSFLYSYKYYRRFKNSREKKSSMHVDYRIEELDEPAKSMISKWKSELGNKNHLIITDRVRDFHSRGPTNTVMINPNVLRNADPRDSEASFYHEWGHLQEFPKFMLEVIVVMVILMFYASLTALDSARGEIPIIPIFSSLGVFLILYTWVSWRREYRADKFASTKVGMEFMKIMFDSMPVRYDLESHPSPDKRWKKLHSLGK